MSGDFPGMLLSLQVAARGATYVQEYQNAI